MEHVFWTWSAQAKVSPIAVKRAKGVYFWDVNDKRYLDFNSMTMCVNIGHGDERVIEAIVQQARQLPYAAPGMTNKVRALASKLVAEVSPGGMHGYLPDLPAMRATFIIAGPGVPRGRALGLVDQRAIAPTLARILGVRLQNAEVAALKP